MVCKTGMGAKLHPWFVVVGAMRAARRPPEALAVVPASLHPLYTADDRCRWMLLHTLCAMHTAVCERELVQHGRPYTNHGFVKGVQIGSLCTNHGLYTGCNFAPTTVLQTMVCMPICTPYTNHGLLANCVSCTNHGLYTGCKLHPWYNFLMFFTTCTKVVSPCTRASGGDGGRSGGVSAKGRTWPARSCRYGSVARMPHGDTRTTAADFQLLLCSASE